MLRMDRIQPLMDVTRMVSAGRMLCTIALEYVFSYPGIGYQLVTAVGNDDYPLMQGIFLVITLAVLGANLLVDLLHGFIDPRTRLSR